MTNDIPPQLSIVVANLEGGQDLGPALAALAVTLGDQSGVELLIIGSGDLTNREALPEWSVTRLHTPDRMLVPDQWGVGLRAATGKLVGFLTPEILVRPGWWGPG